MHDKLLASARRQLLDATRGDFLFFLRRVVATTSPAAAYQHNWHIAAIGEYLAACARGDITRLLINLPPRMLKSTIVSVAWPAWLLGQKPHARIMAASYAQSLAIRHSTDCRVVTQSRWYREAFPATQLAPDQNEKEKFTTTARGYRLAVSVGGAALGEGGDVLIVDDPLNPLQATHQAQRAGVNAWFDHTFATRLDDKQKGAIVVVMQRLHPEDLSGHLLAKGGWEQLCLPALAPAKTTVRMGAFHYERAAGEPLHPARENAQILERTKRELGSGNFSAQYQQAPQQRLSALIRPEWFARSAVPGTGICVQSWDTAIKAGDAHDASACATFIEHEGRHHLADMLVTKLEYPELRRAIIAHAERYAPDAVLIEDKASGQSLLQDLRRETTLPLLACSANADKLTRLVRVTPMMEAGQVLLPEHASWLAAFEEELFAFPDGAHDDQVDAMSQYLNWVRAKAIHKALGIRRI